MRTRRARQVAERKDGLESVGCLLLIFLPIAVAIRSYRFDGRICRPRCRARRREGGKLGGRWRKEDYLLRFEGCELGGIQKGRFEDADLWGYHELLVSRRDR